MGLRVSNYKAPATFPHRGVFPPSGEYFSDSVFVETVRKGLVANPKFVCNLNNHLAFIKHLFRFSDVPLKATRETQVGRSLHNYKIAGRIVGFVSVNMMDMFIWLQFSPKMLFHDVSMYKHYLPFYLVFKVAKRSHLGLPIPRHVGLIARAGTVFVLSLLKRLPATITNRDNHIVYIMTSGTIVNDFNGVCQCQN